MVLPDLNCTLPVEDGTEMDQQAGDEMDQDAGVEIVQDAGTCTVLQDYAGLGTSSSSIICSKLGVVLKQESL